jgi:hypothetical protein
VTFFGGRLLARYLIPVTPAMARRASSTDPRRILQLIDQFTRPGSVARLSACHHKKCTSLIEDRAMAAIDKPTQQRDHMAT